MKNLWLTASAILLFAAGFTATAKTVKFSDDLASWKQARIGCEPGNGRLRVSVLAGAKGNYGQLWKYLPPIPEGKYIQIKVDGMENSSAFAWVLSNSTSVRRSFGVLFQGVNTFSPRVKTSFAFSITQNGGGKKQPGAWVNYDSYTISAAPENSLVAVKEPAAGALKVGDTVNFKIFRSTPCSNPVKIRVFVTATNKRDLQNFRLNKTNEFNAVYDAATQCYTASVKVTGDAYSMDSVKNKMYMVAAADLDGVNTYFTMPFAVQLQTAHKLPTALFTADSPITRDNRQAWFDMVLGKENLALNKPVQLIPKPNYHLTVDKKGQAGCDKTDLTDGNITKRTSDTIWFDRRAVGFYGGVNTVFMRLDLGAVKPVDYIALRALGGSESGFRWPKKFEVLISRDGEKFFNAAEMVKLAPAEAYQSDFVNTYYYPETLGRNRGVCKAFKLKVNAEAQHIIVKLTLDKHFFSDEMAVIASDGKAADFNSVYDGKGFAVPNDSLTAQPRLPELAVVKCVAAPQQISISDYRAERNKIKKAEVILELPDGLTVYNRNSEKITINGKNYNRYHLPTKDGLKVSYIYILSNEKTPDTLPPANIYVVYDGKTGFKQSLPIKIVTLPEFKTFKQLPVCLSWMTTEAMFDSYPDLLKNYMRFGFNGAGVFPRLWIRNPNSDPSEKIKRYEEIRNTGLKLYMNDSAMHEMIRNKKAGHEVYCITKTPSKITCPSYTGKFYKKEMDRIARCVVMSKPDHVLLDIECFNYAFRRSTKECSRCVEAIKNSGLSAEEYILSCGKRMISDISKALEKGSQAANIPMPKLHMYDLDRLDNRHGITRFTDLYPELIKSSQPSLYIGGHPAVIQKNIRGNYKLMQTKDILPWLSTGCYGEYDSYLVEPIVLEAFMNGAGGVLNYAFNHFADSPLDFYYHALAVMKLAPYEELLIKGEYPEIKGSNNKMFYSMVKNGKEMLLLVGNYYKAAPETVVSLPCNKAEVLDLNTREKSTTGKDFKMNVEPGKFNLYYLKAK